MESTDVIQDSLRQQILDDPGVVLGDQAIIRALIGRDQPAGRNIVDLRGVLIDRLEDRLERLEDSHRDVIAAAYENLAGTQQVHRASLAVIAPLAFNDLLAALVDEVPGILMLDAVRLCLEGAGMMTGQPLGPKGALRRVMIGLPEGGRRAYCGETDPQAGPGRPVILRATTRAGALIYGSDAAAIRSEAVIKLDLGQGKRPGMLVLGSADPARFHPDQASDLLHYFGQVFEAVLRRWLA